jgi:predicted helicase
LAAMAVDSVFDYCLLKMGNGGTQSLPLWRYDESGRKVDNITDWALKQFKDHYKSAPSPQPLSREGRGAKAKAPAITKEAIFHYVYAVLHDPVYREKYAQNLKREFPRIPFYPDFWRWAQWGRELMDLHIGYESVEPWPLTRIDIPDENARKNGVAPKARLKADQDDGRIVLDSETTLAGIPPEAWDYKLGNRCALEWILDQYKEKTPKDPTIRAKFNTYRFADYKDKVIDLLARVTRVSLETQRIVTAMRGSAR